jgi:hypothetical protein
LELVGDVAKVLPHSGTLHFGLRVDEELLFAFDALPGLSLLKDCLLFDGHSKSLAVLLNVLSIPTGEPTRPLREVPSRQLLAPADVPLQAMVGRQQWEIRRPAI